MGAPQPSGGGREPGRVGGGRDDRPAGDQRGGRGAGRGDRRGVRDRARGARGRHRGGGPPRAGARGARRAGDRVRGAERLGGARRAPGARRGAAGRRRPGRVRHRNGSGRAARGDAYAGTSTPTGRGWSPTSSSSRRRRWPPPWSPPWAGTWPATPRRSCGVGAAPCCRRSAPTCCVQRATQARERCALRRWAEEPGVDKWEGTFPSEDAARAWAAIDARAQQLVADGTCERIDRARPRP